MCQRSRGKERLAVGRGLFWGVADECGRSLGELGRRLVCRGQLRADRVEMRAGPDPARFDDGPLGAGRQDDKIGVHDRLLGGVRGGGLEIELRFGSPSEPLAVLAGRTEDSDPGQRSYGRDRPELCPGLDTAADDPDARGVRSSECVDGGAAKRSGSAGAEFAADDAPLQASIALPDENHLIRFAPPEPVDTNPDRAPDVAAGGEDQSVVAEVRTPPRWCGEEAPISVDHGLSRCTDGIGGVESSADIVVEQKLHVAPSDRGGWLRARCAITSLETALKAIRRCLGECE